MFKRILIANRGEIALRVIRACREMGIGTVCVFSEADRGAAYLELADDAVCIGPPAATASYLKGDRIIAAAEVTGAEAIHPGYGFLAENSQFADMCRDSNIEFIGPSAAAMRLLGNKAAARRLAKKCKIDIIPGSDGVTDDAEAEKVAEKIGYPVMIKPSSGGGGRGMRVVSDQDHLASALSQARQESQAAFNDSEVYIEKFIDRPRHVEVQVIADNHGTIRHLHERDCSVQRRHQKLIEETPSPSLASGTRRSLCAAAVKLAKAAHYTNAGTFEFLVDPKGKYYFIEANTRIQVEHPVTEATTGVDLIKTQIRVAAGEKLSFTQKSIVPRGAAIECRINAEDPSHGFRPCPGLIDVFRPPGGLGVRLDTHVHSGHTISRHYDSLIGKLIVHQPTRAEAIATMLRCLSEFVIEPTRTTIPFHQKILSHADFQAGKVDTSFIERVLQP